MKLDLTKFKGTLPYASELFGIYQPLLGWKSKQIQARLTKGKDVLSGSFTAKALSRIHPEIPKVISSENNLVFSGALKVPLLRETVHVGVSPEIYGVASLLIAERLNPAETKPETKWRLLKADKLDAFFVEVAEMMKTMILYIKVNEEPPGSPKIIEHVRRILAEERGEQEGVIPLGPIVERMLNWEASIISYLNWLYNEKKWDLLETLFYKDVQNSLNDILSFSDPLENFGENGLDAVLSPVGMVNVFRQYFFDFETFLGPSVGHVWIAPGGTVELTEVNSQRVVTEKSYESFSESTVKTEESVTTHDEISNAVKDENKSNTKFGFDTSVKYTIQGTLEAGGNTNLSMDSSRTTSRETTSKQMRDQSQKLSSEIRKSFKSTFKVSTDVLDSTTRRYVIQNTTDKLVNYELRRKMRQVGIQVQDISTQLCWQTYVDRPGDDLGLAKLLHIAQSADFSGLQAPEAPIQLLPKQVESMVQFAFENISGGDDRGTLYRYGDDGDGKSGIRIGFHNDRIIWRRSYKADPPAPGYTMDNYISWQSQHQGVLSADVNWLDANGNFEVILKEVNFEDQPNVNLKVVTTWKPAQAHLDALDKEYDTKYLAYTAEKAKLTQEAFLKAARERVKLASQISTRNFEELREEERILVYRKLIGKLMSVGEKNHEHVTSELIRSMFDVDKMLYFVAPEWWQPRYNQKGQTMGSNTNAPIEPTNEVGWGGLNEINRSSYYITEESSPARMGSSLGWLMQLDGDNLRNMFLNSPWVKAVIPIRPGKEQAALNWLTQAHVEGTDGLDADYVASDKELAAIRKKLTELKIPLGKTITLRDAFTFLANQVQEQFKKASTVSPHPSDPSLNALPTETVFEHGFYPLQGSFKVNEDPLKVFAQWTEIVPTQQVVAVEYDASKHL